MRPRTKHNENAMMSNESSPTPSDKPQGAVPTTTPPASQPPPQAPADKPNRVNLMRDKKPRGTVNAGRVPSLEHEQSYGFGKKIDAFDAEMEQELQEAMSGFDQAALIEPDPAARQAQAPGSGKGPKKGRVFRIHGPDVFIEMPGSRHQGVLPLLQFEEGPPALGTEIDVHIEGFDSKDGLLRLSRQGAAVDVDWDSVANGMIVEARVTETNKGGLAVEVNGIRGFMPISQIDLYRVENAEQFVNQRLRCLVTEVNPDERNLVVSRRALLEKEREETREKTWNELAEGQVREGIVRSVKDFGAFVDLGGVDGLVHISEMSWTRVQNASQMVSPGEKVKVVVLKIDPERRKISLGMKQLQESPWDRAVEKYPPGTLVTGKVTRIMDFGAFVELEPGIEGLIHISELSPQRVRRVADIVQSGATVQVMVLNVDREQRRIALSLKAALPEDEPEAAEEEEDDTPPPAPRPRTRPLRGGNSERLPNV
jgi:small subunit ribosomal protein S1